MDTITFVFVLGLFAVSLFVTAHVRRDFLSRQRLRGAGTRPAPRVRPRPKR